MNGEIYIVNILYRLINFCTTVIKLFYIDEANKDQDISQGQLPEVTETEATKFLRIVELVTKNLEYCTIRLVVEIPVYRHLIQD